MSSTVSLEKGPLLPTVTTDTPTPSSLDTTNPIPKPRRIFGLTLPSRRRLLNATFWGLLLSLYWRSICQYTYPGLCPPRRGYIGNWLFPEEPQVAEKTEKGHTPSIGVPEKIQRHWGQYAPYFAAGEYVEPPSGCEITQVNILQRHGARYPTEEDDYNVSVSKLQTAKHFTDPRLDFLKEYKYDLGKEDLLPFGAAQSFEAGEVAFRRYSHLAGEKRIPFVRASGLERVVESALNWTVGFAAASKQRYNPTVNFVIPEDQNNTLNNDCPNAGEGDEEKNTWLSVFAPPIRERLMENAPGAEELTDHDVFNLLAMCPFESMAKQRKSGFCDLFTAKEFKEFEYHGDVEKFYKTGYGEELGPIQGVGYVNELLARLTGRPVQDRTQHNDSQPFPLDHTIYADFTHENEMIAVFSAMGLFNTSSNPLDLKKMKENREWIASKMVPFSARMVVEKLTCSEGSLTSRIMGGHHGEDEGKGTEEFVRVLVNDAVQPLEFCEGASKRGVCALEAFVNSQEYARHDGHGDFEKCYN